MQTLILVQNIRCRRSIRPSPRRNGFFRTKGAGARGYLVSDWTGTIRTWSSAALEPKAIETAEIASGSLKIPLEIVEGLHEHERVNVGFLEKERFEQSIRRLYEQPSELVFGEEMADSAHDRFSMAVHRLMDCYPKENIAIVTHGTVLSLFVSRNSDLEPFALWKKLGLPSWVVLSRRDFRVIEICPSIEDVGSSFGV